MLQSLFKAYSVWYKYCYPCFLFIFMEYIFFLLTFWQFVCMCVSRPEINLLQAAYIWVFFLTHSVSIYLDNSVYLYILIYSVYW